MKRRIALASVILLAGAALFLSEKRKADAPVRPDPILYFIADTEHELTRAPAALTRLSDAEEIRIGNDLAWRYSLYFRAVGQETETRAVEEYVQRVGMQVAARAHRKLPYKFHYIPNPDFINAFALPGGHVFMGGGLMALMDSEDELAAVLGHEVEHIDHYHCAERVQTEATLRKIPLGGLVAIPVEIFEAGYSKDQELEADREGTRLAVWARYSPLGAIRMFEAFDRLYHEQISRAKTPQEEISRLALETLEGYFRSHPRSSERIDQIRRMIADQHWENLNRERELGVAYIFWTGRARQALVTKHYEQAAALAARSLVLRADQPEALKILAQAKFLLADFAASVAAYRKLLDIFTPEPGLVREYADALAATGDRQKALQDFKDWISRRNASSPLTDVELAGLELMAGNGASAEEILRKAQEPANAQSAPEWLGRLGWWYYRAGNYDRATIHLQNAANQRPGALTLEDELGWALIEQRNYRTALQSFHNPMGVAVTHWLGQEPDRALPEFASASLANPEWRNSRWVKALYSPLIVRSLAEMQAEQEKRKTARRASPDISR